MKCGFPAMHHMLVYIYTSESANAAVLFMHAQKEIYGLMKEVEVAQGVIEKGETLVPQLKLQIKELDDDLKDLMVICNVCLFKCLQEEDTDAIVM